MRIDSAMHLHYLVAMPDSHGALPRTQLSGRRLLCWILLAVAMICGELLIHAEPKGIRIKKVLAQFLDTNGLHTVSPSLLERDAYQAELRRDPSRRGGLRFDVLCSAIPPGAELTLKVEALGSHAQRPTHLLLEKHLVLKDHFHRWQALTATGRDYTAFGELVAWRASLWRSGVLVAEQKSFLW